MLEKFLDNKPLFYDEIDYGRMPRIYNKISAYLKLPKIIHLVGTNGKGTTGRYLASALFSLGYQTGHYTSPHILHFNERIWLNQENVDDKLLNKYHMQLLNLLDQKDAQALSYFEYTTLLAMLIYSKEGCEYVVLEAGLGGEHDATAVFDNILTVVTPIGKDHEAFLGSMIEEIARTKLLAVQKRAILAQQPFKEVYKVASNIAKERDVAIYNYEKYIDEQDIRNVQDLTKKLSLANYLQENLMVAIAALKYLNIPYVKENFYEAQLFGRLTSLNENIIIDVGHNTLAAKRIKEAIGTKKYVLIYNSYKDKAYKEIISVLAPSIKHIEIIDVDDERIEKRELLEAAINENLLDFKDFKMIENNEKYLVFGSFSVVEAFLKVYNG